ncbi:MAG: DUF4215 domain-containing protein, partial [Myxococcota bacterium]|nr:DUF4215 domain-containing protein [Myxococcota bacterium]
MAHLIPRRYLLVGVLIGALVAPATALSVCGDSVLVAGEVCDDGNTVSGDGCSDSCEAIEAGWVCPTVGQACECKEGFTGVTCSECSPGFFGAACLECPGNASTPCSEAGTCDDGVSGSGVCVCDSGHWGADCSSECPGGADNSCSLHGVCDDGAAGNGQCTCDPGFYGPDCQGECPGGFDAACSSNGTCDDGASGSGICSCEVGYFGGDCSSQCPGGAVEPCGGTGVCDDGASGSGECTCDPGFYGSDCTQQCPGGAASPCNGNGSCLDGAEGTGACQCSSGFFGSDCSGVCPGAPDAICNLQGTCDDGANGSGQCICDTGYYASECSEQCPGPAGEPCSFNGVCDDGISGSGSCTCSSGYFGLDCGGICPGGANTPCSNNGSCDDGVDGSGACTCGIGFTGSDCADTLQLSVSLSQPALSVPGQIVEIDIQVTNSGTAPIPAATLALSSITGASVTGIFDGSFNLGAGPNFPLSALNSGDSLLLKLVLALDSPMTSGLAAIPVSVTLTANQIVPVLKSKTIPVDRFVDLKLTTTTHSSAVPGDVLTHQLTYSNAGNEKAKGTKLTAVLPPQSAFVSQGSHSSWNCVSGICTSFVGQVQPGGGATRTLKYAISSGVAAGTDNLTFTASITDNGNAGPDRVPGDNGVTDGYVINAAPDLALDVVAGAPTPTNQTATWQLQVSNVGNEGATGVQLAVSVPSHTTFLSSSVGPWSCTGGEGPTTTCVANLGSMSTGDIETMTFQGAIAKVVPLTVSSITLSADVSQDGANGAEPSLANNADAASVALITGPNLVITAAAGGSQVTPGSVVTYTLSILNDGSRPSGAVTLSAEVPLGSTFSSENSSSGWSCGNGAAGDGCVLSPTPIPVGGIATSQLAFRVLDAVPANLKMIKCTAAANDDGANGPELVPSDNAAFAQIGLVASPVFELSTRHGGATFGAGDTVVFSHQYSNIASQDASGVTLKVVVPDHMVFDATASQPSIWVCDNAGQPGTECTSQLGDVAVGDSGTAFLGAVVVDDPPDANISSIATVQDDGNNAISLVSETTASISAQITPCSTVFTFETGTSGFISDAPDLWAYDEQAAEWRTGGDGFIPPGLQTGRLTRTVDVPQVAVGGTAPRLIVEYRLNGSLQPNFDVFAVCLDTPDCTGLTAGNAFQSGMNTGAGFTNAEVDLSAYAGTSVQVTLLFDTIKSTGVGDIDGVRIRRVRLESDVDNDGLDGSLSACDRCWDGDGDTFFHPKSPDISSGTCGAVEPDCDDSAPAINPAGTEVCDAPADEDCDGFINGQDEDCGGEDCANEIDDNLDGFVDCDDPLCVSDPFCGVCSTRFNFKTGGGGWIADDTLPNGDGPVFEYGKSAFFDGASGWETVLNKDVSTLGAEGPVRATLSKNVLIPTGLYEPTVRLVYALSGGLSIVEDVFGVCFNPVSAASCNAANAAFVSGSKASSLTSIDIAIPTELIGTEVNIVVFFDSVTTPEAPDSGLFLSELGILSDVDNDGLSERADPLCDRCVDADDDGYGAAETPPQFVVECVHSEADCDDANEDTYPQTQENCQVAGDNDCNGLNDIEEVVCSVCGDGVITAGEECDDSNASNGDGCNASCQLESDVFYITEVHITGEGPQWIELYNKTPADIDLGLLGLTIATQTGAS